MGWFSDKCDSLVAAVNPQRGLERMAARHRMEKAAIIRDRIRERRGEFSAGGYQSTENSRDAHSWLTSNLSADSALEEDRATMVERTDSACKNYELAANHVEGRVTRVAGSGMTVEPEIGVHLLEQPSEAEQKRLDELNETLRVNWERTCERIGRNGEELYELQQQWARDYERRGEFFALIGDEYDPLAPTTLKVEHIDPDRVSTPNGMSGDKTVRMGIKIDAKGRPVGCYIQSTHPNDTLNFRQVWKYEPFYLPNGLPRVIHHFAKVWPGQHRGFPMMQVGIRRLKNKEEYSDAELERLFVAACHVGVIHTMFDGEEAMDSHGVLTDSAGRRVNEMSPGRFIYAEGADTVEFNKPDGPSGSFAPFQEHEGRMFAAGCQTHYEIIAGEWKNVSYSNGRLIWNAEEGTTAILQLGHEKAIKWIYRHFVTRAINEDLIDVDPIEYRSDPWTYWASRVIYPPKQSIDPSREDRNEMMLIEGSMKPAGEMAERVTGKPARLVYAAVARDRKLRRRYELEEHMPQMNRDMELMPEDADGTGAAPTQPGDGNRKSSDANRQRQEAGA